MIKMVPYTNLVCLPTIENLSNWTEMKPSISTWIIIFIFLVGILPVYSNYPSYDKIDSILKKTWDEQFPTPYQKIKKKNINGKGILKYAGKQNTIYIYTFLVFFSHQKVEDKMVVEDKGGREMLVKLYHDPQDKLKPYWIEIGELDEEQDRKKFLGYTN
jgi:hypothetical protein